MTRLSQDQRRYLDARISETTREAVEPVRAAFRKLEKEIIKEYARKVADAVPLHVIIENSGDDYLTETWAYSLKGGHDIYLPNLRIKNIPGKYAAVFADIREECVTKIERLEREEETFLTAADKMARSLRDRVMLGGTDIPGALASFREELSKLAAKHQK